MANTNISTFDKYELLRILIPGFYFASLTFLIVQLFVNNIIEIDISIFLSLQFFLLLILVSGLTFYAKETTKRRKAFSENLPSLYILEVARKYSNYQLLEVEEARKLYFYILNNYIPAVFHDKFFFSLVQFTI